MTHQARLATPLIVRQPAAARPATARAVALPSPATQRRPGSLLWLSLLAALLIMASLTASPVARASGDVVQDDRYVVYYGTVHTRLVPDAVAKKNGIIKSRERGLLTISVHRKRSDGSTQPVLSQLSGNTVSGGGRQVPLEFDVAQENGYVSYSAGFVFPDGKPLDFEVNVNTAADHPGFRLRFSSTLYAEE
jgi:hypothetical protein